MHVHPTTKRTTYTHAEWIAEGERRFGPDRMKWRWICPACQTVQGISDLLEAGVDKAEVEKYVAFSCVGRFNECKTGCPWTLGGLLRIHEVELEAEGDGKPTALFAFAPSPIDPSQHPADVAEQLGAPPATVSEIRRASDRKSNDA